MTAATITDIRQTLAADPARTVQILAVAADHHRANADAYIEHERHIDMERVLYVLICRENTLGRPATDDEIAHVFDTTLIDD